MSREVHAQFCERVGVRLPRATLLIITGSSKELLGDEVKPLVEAFLATRGLELSQEKTRITHVAEGFDFLGQTVRRFGRAVIITPSKKNVQAFMTKVKSIFAAQKTATQENLIAQLNPVIRGWANYHRAVNASKLFAAIDDWLWRKAWQWARRRHPNKRARWTKAKYFATIGQRHWVFVSRTTDLDGRRKNVALVRASDTKIRRHAKIKGEANPYDPQWETYFEDRLGLKMQGSLRGRRKLLYFGGVRTSDACCVTNRSRRKPDGMFITGFPATKAAPMRMPIWRCCIRTATVSFMPTVGSWRPAPFSGTL